MGELEFRVLGPVEVLRRGESVTPRGGTTLTLLAGLLLRVDDVVATETITEWVWGDDRPVDPRAALYNAVSRLRRLLGENVIRTEAFGYRLVVEAARVDLLEFDALVGSASEATMRGAPGDAVALLDRALALWRGPPLANVHSPALRRAVVGDLTGRYRSARDERARQYRIGGPPGA